MNKEFKSLNNNYHDAQKEADNQRLKKCIAELEVTARHFKLGKIWSIVVETRNKLKEELD